MSKTILLTAALVFGGAAQAQDQCPHEATGAPSECTASTSSCDFAGAKAGSCEASRQVATSASTAADRKACGAKSDCESQVAIGGAATTANMTESTVATLQRAHTKARVAMEEARLAFAQAELAAAKAEAAALELACVTSCGADSAECATDLACDEELACDSAGAAAACGSAGAAKACGSAGAAKACGSAGAVAQACAGDKAAGQGTCPQSAAEVATLSDEACASGKTCDSKQAQVASECSGEEACEGSAVAARIEGCDEEEECGSSEECGADQNCDKMAAQVASDEECSGEGACCSEEVVDVAAIFGQTAAPQTAAPVNAAQFERIQCPDAIARLAQIEVEIKALRAELSGVRQRIAKLRAHTLQRGIETASLR